MTENMEVTTTTPVPAAQPHGAARNMSDLVRKMLLAGIGAAALMRDESKVAFDKLVERGAAAERELRKDADHLAERSKEQGEHAQGRLEKQLESVQEQLGKQIESVLGRMNIPSRDDVVALDAKVSALSAKIDALNPEGPAAAAPLDETPVA